MEKKFYIDESGNTGDLIITKNNSNFSSQEYFTLACISLNDAELDEINEYIKKLKLKYKIHMYVRNCSHSYQLRSHACD